LRTHQGNGADSYVRSDASDDYGAKAMLQGSLDGESNQEHIYLRLDLSRLPRARSDLDRAILLLTVRAGGYQGQSEFAVYGIQKNLMADWAETGGEHLSWETSPCRSGIGGQKYLGRCSFNNAKDNLKDAQDQIRFFGAEFDEFIRNAESDLVTLVLIRQSTSNRPTRFHSKEGKPDLAPALAVRFRESEPTDDSN
ncbi:MAG: DUF7594 domain-containing protein, partial [Rubripirellula sp.]